ncbi:MAG: MFS transporter [Opitutales bacterium]|nr:MFS transporter [Opitutales bacterium]
MEFENRKFLGLFYLSRALCARIAAASFFFLFGIGFSCWATRIADIKNALFLSDAQLGGLLFTIPVGQFCAIPFSGYLVNKFGSRNVLTFAIIYYPLALMSLGLAESVGQLRIGLFFFGIACNLCNIAMNTQAVGVEKIYRRSIMASFHGIWSLAGFLGGLAAIQIVRWGATPFQHFCLMGVLSVATLVLMRPHLLESDAPKPPKSETDDDNNKSLYKKFSFLFDGYIAILGFIAFCSMSCEGTMFDWSVIYFQDVVKADASLIRLGFICYMSMMATGRFLADRFVVKFGAIRVVQASGTLIAIGLFIAVFKPSIWASAAGFALVGLGVSSLVPLCYSLAGQSKRLAAGIALTGVSSIGFLGFLMGPPMIGYIADTFGLRFSFSIILFIGLAAAILAPRLKGKNA